MAQKKKALTFRFPYNGDSYTAESATRIRVQRGNQWGYFTDRGQWQEGPLRYADPCFCRFLSSSWMVEQDPVGWGLTKKKPSKKKSMQPAKRSVSKSAKSQSGGARR